jgi:hypothetical protein
MRGGGAEGGYDFAVMLALTGEKITLNEMGIGVLQMLYPSPLGRR